MGLVVFGFDIFIKPTQARVVSYLVQHELNAYACETFNLNINLVVNTSLIFEPQRYVIGVNDKMFFGRTNINAFQLLAYSLRYLGKLCEIFGKHIARNDEIVTD